MKPFILSIWIFISRGVPQISHESQMKLEPELFQPFECEFQGMTVIANDMCYGWRLAVKGGQQSPS